jgi:hypothetical protein
MAEETVSQSKKISSQWTGWHTAGLVIILVLVVLAGLLIPLRDRFWAWVLTLLLLAAFTIVAGQGITGLWRGLLIDERNKISLSRLQVTLWAIVVLSGFLTAALSNLASGQPSPLSIAIPREIWLLMGISTTSLVASPLIKNTKKAKAADPGEIGQTSSLLAKQMGVDTVEGKVDHQGQLVVNKSFEDATWSDLFKGEETGNAAHLDLGKVQMFYFTLILVLAYAVALGTAFAGSSPGISEFPSVDSSMVALLGISHGGYLTNKAISHSQTA